jgi:hypothetical protein
LLPKNFDESANYALNVKFGDEFQPVIANLIAPKSAIVIVAAVDSADEQIDTDSELTSFQVIAALATELYL